MASQVFYRKWRSQTLAELVGQKHVTQTLLNALKSGSISHAYLFCGPRGTGKTSTARILAKAINCLTNGGKGEPCNTCEMCRAITEDRAMDVIEIDAASNRGIDDIRDLREKVNYAPTQARRKVYIIDEFHMLSKDASNALLKTLEEPPPHVVFILATTEAHKVLPTILSRCQHFDFHRHTTSNIASKLGQVCNAENIIIDQPSLNLIARSATGSLRDAYNLLEQIYTFYGPTITFSQVQATLGIIGDLRAKEIVKYMMNNDIAAGMATLNSINNDGLDLPQFNRELVEYLRALLLVKTGAPDTADLIAEDLAELKELASKTPLSRILTAVKLFGQIQMGGNEATSLPLELALVESYLTSAPDSQVNVSAQPAAKSHASTISQPKPSASEATTAKAEPQPAHYSKPEVATAPVRAQAAQNKPAEEASINEPVPAMVKEPAKAPSLSSELERLKLNWKQIIDADSNLKKTTASALLRSGCRPLSVEGEVVKLAFGFDIQKDKMEKPENKKVAEQIISNYLGHACRITCVCDSKKDHLVNLAKKYGAQVTSVEEK